MRNSRVINYPDRGFSIKKLSSEERFLQEQRLHMNRDMSSCTPLKKIKKIKELRKNYEANKLLAQITKNEIIEEKKHERESKLRLKFNKLEIRLKKGVFFI